MGPMFIVVVMTLDGTIEDVVGPFWYENTADLWAGQTARKRHKRCTVKRVRERQEWEAGQ